MYVGKGTLAGFGATKSNNPFEQFLNPLMNVGSQITRTASSMIPGLVPGGAPAKTSTSSAAASTYDAALAPVAKSKAPYLMAGVGILGIVGLVMFARSKKK